MDAMTQLALMTKAEKVFGKNNTFLSFPVTPLTFKKTDLEFGGSQNLNTFKEFSLLVNSIPESQAWAPTTGSYLWDIYDEILRGMDTELAISTRTPEEENQYQKASNLLRVNQPDSFPEDSPTFKLYKQYRDRWFTLQEKYKETQIRGEFSDDLTIQKQWNEVEKPALQKELSNLETQWIHEGYKYEVEEAQSIRARLGAKSPSKTWAQWQSQLNPDIDRLTTTDNITFYPSSFSPINALAEASWQPFSLNAGEVNAMLKEVPETLRSRLDPDISNSDVESISFEFSSAAIVRPWGEPDIFQARYWKFSDPTKQLSDGQTPPSGLCPAYVTAVVFARNISVITKVKSKIPKGALAKGLQFPNAVQVAKIAPTSKLYRQPPIVIKPQPDINVPALQQPLRTIKHVVNPNRIQQPLTPLKVAPIRAKQVAVPNQALLRLQKTAIVRPALKKDTRESAAVDRSRRVTTPKDQIYILAFICKLLPACPNPDATLQW